MTTQDFEIFQAWAQEFTNAGFSCDVNYGDETDAELIEQGIGTENFYRQISGLQTFPNTGVLPGITNNAIVTGRMLMSVIGARRKELQDNAAAIVEELQKWLDNVYNVIQGDGTSVFGKPQPRPFAYGGINVFEFDIVDPASLEVEPFGTRHYIAAQLVEFSATTLVAP